MRLIDVETLELQEFFGANIPQYAILSHTWGEKEVNFQDWQSPTRRTRIAGFAKIDGARRQARRTGLRWLWVDTNCIDKTSSAELSEAINSMFVWYQRSAICFVYLEDVVVLDTDKGRVVTQFGSSRWFTRGWTLQELLAPQDVQFYDKNWKSIGSRNNALARHIEASTGIERDYLDGSIEVKKASVAKKMSWLSTRTTTRDEDIAYCMLGLFDINMPLLYGEGAKAFVRLQEEIFKVSNDHTLFCWQWRPSTPLDWASFLAPAPSAFKDSSGVTQKEMYRFQGTASERNQEISTYQMTNAGLSIRLPVLYTWVGFIVALEASPDHTTGDERYLWAQYWLPVYGDQRAGVLYIQREAVPTGPLILDDDLRGYANRRSIIVRKRLDTLKAPENNPWKSDFGGSRSEKAKYFGCFFVFHSSKLRDAWLRHNARNSYILSNFIWLEMRFHTSCDVGYSFLKNVFKGQDGARGYGKKWGSLFFAVRRTVSPASITWFVKAINHPKPLEDTEEIENMENKLVRWVIGAREGKHTQVCFELNLRIRLGEYDMVGVADGKARLLLFSELKSTKTGADAPGKDFDHSFESAAEDAASDDSNVVVLNSWDWGS